MGIKDFFKKIGNCFRKVGRWIKDKALPVVGKIAKPVLNVIGMLPGKIGAIGKVGSGIVDVLNNVTNKIPNKDAREKISNVIDKGSSVFHKVIDKGKTIADGANKAVDVGKQMIGTAKEGFNNIVKPAIPAIKLNPIPM